MNKNNISTILLILIVIVLGSFYFTMDRNYNDMMYDDHHEEETVKNYEIYPGDVVEKIKSKEDIILLDVRTAEEYKEVHLENALLLSVEELSVQSLTDIGLGENMKNKEIIIYCRSGARSKIAYDIMNSLGYTNIKSVTGGMIHWEEDEYPFMESGAYMGSSVTPGNNSPAVVVDSPKIALDRTLHDFGLIPQYGGVVTTTFKINNTGEKTLTIGDISTSCACTTAEVSKVDIPVGASAILTVYFDPDFHTEPEGVFKRTVFVPTNDPVTPEAELVIQVDIDEGN